MIGKENGLYDILLICYLYFLDVDVLIIGIEIIL